MFFSSRNWQRLCVRGLLLGLVVLISPGLALAQRTADSPWGELPQKDLARDWIIGECLSERSGWTAYGFWDTCFTFNPQNPSDRANGPVYPNYRSNDIQMVSIYMVLQKNIDMSQDKVQWGFRSDFEYGTMGINALGNGVDEYWTTNGAYRLALPQCYGTLFVPTDENKGWEFRVGHFLTPLGYESTFLPANFFLSKTYSSGQQPSTHTGGVFGYHFNEHVAIRGGVTMGWDTWEFFPNGGWGYLAIAEWKDKDEKNKIYFALVGGPAATNVPILSDLGVPGLNPDSPTQYDFRFDYSLIYQRQLDKEKKAYYIIEHDLGFRDGDATLGDTDAMWYSADQWLIYKITDKFWGGFRFTWMGVDQGDLTAGTRPKALLAKGDYYSFSMGLNINPTYNIRFRPELRWDWQSRQDNSARPAYNAGQDNHQFLLGCDMLLLF